MSLASSIHRLIDECTVHDTDRMEDHVDEDKLTAVLIVWLTRLGAHDFVGRVDRPCERCRLPDRDAQHSAAQIYV